VIICFLFASAILAAGLIGWDLDRNGLDESWSYRDINVVGNYTHDYTVMFADEGVTYVQETLLAEDNETWQSYYLALGPHGEVLWKIGHGVRYDMMMGADGNLYYLDRRDPSDQYLAGYAICNLTSLDREGDRRWSFVVDNGSLELWGAFENGTVIARHYEMAFDEQEEVWVYACDELMSIDAGGHLIWTKDINGGDTGDHHLCSGTTIPSNGTIGFYMWSPDGTYNIGLDGAGTEIWRIRMVGTWSSIFAARPVTGIAYMVHPYYLPDGTYLVRLSAYDDVDGHERWTVNLSSTEDPPNVLSCREMWAAAVDGQGMIYCNDGQNRMFGVDLDGQIVWSEKGAGYFIATYGSGGALVLDDGYLFKIGMDGGREWQYLMSDDMRDGCTSILLVDDSVVLIGTENSVTALTPSEHANSITILIVVAAVDLIVLAGYFIYLHGKRAS